MFRFVFRHPLACLFGLILLAGLGFLAWRGYRNWRAERHFQKAQERMAAFRYEAAFDHVGQAVALRPDRGDIQFLAARASRRVMNMPAAKDHLHAAEKLLGDTDDIRLEKQLLVVQRGDADDLAEYTVWLRAKSDDANRPLILEALVRGALESYRLLPAKKAVETWLEEPTDDARPYFWHALVYDQLGGDLENLAITEYEISLGKNPDFDECRLRLGDILLRKSNPHAAWPHYDLLHKRRPDNIEIAVGLAQCLAGVGESDAACKLLDDVLAREGTNVPALRQRAILAMNYQNDSDRAEAMLWKANDHDPLDLATGYNLFLCLHRRGKDKEADDVLARHEAWAMKFERLRKILRGDLAARPDDPKVLCEAAAIALESGRTHWLDLCRGWLERALRIAPNYQPALKLLGDYYERTHRPALAEQYRAKAK
jgi:tetratricopeptide (TPR) repeat protein